MLSNTMGGGSGLYADVAIIGHDFTPGKAGNIEILSLAEQVCPDLEDFTSDHILLELGAECRTVKGDDGWIAMLSDGAHAFVTVPFPREAHAVSAAIHHLLLSKSVVT